MFTVDPETKEITMHRGDTGTLLITLRGYDFSNVNARALFTMRVNGEIIKEEIHEIDSDNQFSVSFTNPDTDGMGTVRGEYDVRVIIDPEFDDGGKIVDGTIVTTPEDPITVNIRRTVGVV